jgi:hypothetical protein
MIAFSFAALAALAGCARPGAVETSVRYYEGTSVTTSPDGATPYGPEVAVLVRRTTNPRAHTIEEYVVHPGQEFPTTLKQVDGNVFDARDAKGSFEGTVAFKGSAWDFPGWDYDIRMTNGTGKVVGHGDASAHGITTDKRFLDTTGAAKARIHEELHTIDEETYRRRLAQLLPGDAK